MNKEAAAAEGAPDVPGGGASSKLWIEDSDCVLERLCDGRYAAASCCCFAEAAGPHLCAFAEAADPHEYTYLCSGPCSVRSGMNVEQTVFSGTKGPKIGNRVAGTRCITSPSTLHPSSRHAQDDVVVVKLRLFLDKLSQST